LIWALLYTVHGWLQTWDSRNNRVDGVVTTVAYGLFIYRKGAEGWSLDMGTILLLWHLFAREKVATEISDKEFRGQI